MISPFISSLCWGNVEPIPTLEFRVLRVVSPRPTLISSKLNSVPTPDVNVTVPTFILRASIKLTSISST